MDDVLFFAHTYELTGEEHRQLHARGVRVVDGKVTKLSGRGRPVDRRRVDGDEVIERTAVFVRPGNVPHADGLLRALGCEVTNAGFAVVDATGRRSTPGVWAAGNVVDPRAQVITAAGAAQPRPSP